MGLITEREVGAGLRELNCCRTVRTVNPSRSKQKRFFLNCNLIYLSVYFGLCWNLSLCVGFSLVVRVGLLSRCRRAGPSPLRWLLLLRNVGLACALQSLRLMGSKQFVVIDSVACTYGIFRDRDQACGLYTDEDDSQPHRPPKEFFATLESGRACGRPGQQRGLCSSVSLFLFTPPRAEVVTAVSTSCGRFRSQGGGTSDKV